MNNEKLAVPEGTYVVRLLDVKCHNANTYKMKIQVLSSWLFGNPIPDTPIITGYARRFSDKYYDLAEWFENGVLHGRTADYVGQLGLVTISYSGWLTPITRLEDTNLFPHAKRIEDPESIEKIHESFRRFLDLYK